MKKMTTKKPINKLTCVLNDLDVGCGCSLADLTRWDIRGHCQLMRAVYK